MTVIERKTGSVKQFTGEGRGTAVLARLGVRDKDGDVLVSGLLGGEQQAPLIQAHDWQIPAFGRAVVRERNGEMIADFTLNMNSPRGKEWASVLAFDLAQLGGPVQAWSWGFSVLPDGSEMGTHEGERVRFLRRIKLHEVSPVVVGASVGSRTLSLKNASVDREELLAYLQSLPREWQEAWLTEAQALCTEARVLLLDVAFDDLSAGKQAYRYVHADPWDGRVSLAKSVVAAACTELGAGFPKSVRFFTSTDEERADFMHVPNLYGLCSKDGVISLSWNLMPAEIIHAAAHEAAHLANMDVDEDAADAFAEEFARRHSAKLLGTRPAVDPMEAVWAMSVMKRWYAPVVPYVHI